MLNMSRRDFVVSTGLAAALGLNARLVVTPAYAQKTPDPAKPFVTYKVGTAEVTAIYDGIWEKAHDPAFISNASVDDVKAAMVKAGLPADFVSIPFTVAVVKTGGKTILCDSGTGGQVQPTAGKLAAHASEAPKPWVPLLLALVLLFVSLSGNVYLGWVAWGERSRSRGLLEKLHTAAGGA